MSEAPSATERVVRFGVFELDQRTGELRKAGVRLALQDQPLHVLTMLLERPGDLVTREDLKQRLWPDHTFVDFEQGLNAAIKRLRTTLGDSAETPRFIETLPRRGYRFIAPVDGASSPEHAVTRSAAGASNRSSALRMVWAAVALAGILVAGVLLSTTRPVRAMKAVPLTSLAGLESQPALSVDGRQVAFCWDGDGQPGLYVRSVGGEEQIRVAQGPAGLSSPTWSPDGREIAFLRNVGPARSNQHEIVVVPALGGAERLLATTVSTGPGLDWSPDGRLLAFVDKPRADAPNAIFILTIGTGERRQLSRPAQNMSWTGDTEPAFSPDGRTVAFVRYHGNSTASDVYVQSLGAGEPRPVTSNQRGITDVGWSEDGRSVVFAGGLPDEEGMSVASVPGREETRRLSVGDHAVAISVSRRGGRLAFEQSIRDVNIWRAPGPAAPGASPATPLLHSTRIDHTPDYSPDGTHIALGSTRSGRHAIWTCDQDGRGCVEFKGGPPLAYPSWSPDGTRIAADGREDQTFNVDIYVLDVRGRFIRRLTDHPAPDHRPVWSRDGRWLYFISNRTGRFELWRMPSEGGEPTQITRLGASRALQSRDGRWMYYCNAMPSGSLWRVPSEGGAETLVFDKRVLFWNWALWRDQLVYIEVQPGPGRRIEVLDLASGRTALVRALETDSGLEAGLAVSPDGRWLLYPQFDQFGSDIMLVDNFDG
jgi:Tol biopolymer transport system component/DNA-binding winged helix-turn-helix (wHTH) protein